MSFTKKLAFSAATVALLAAAPAAVYAQETSANLRGSVVDANGNPLTGATVTILHTASGTASTAVTGSTGAFFESGLRVGGPYTIYISAEGFEGDVLEGLFLQPGPQSPLTIALNTTSREIITVTGAAINTLDLNNGVGSTYSARDIANAPSTSRDVISTLRNDPLVSQSGNGYMSVAGQSPRFNALAIDGSLQQDDFGLGANTYATERSPINIDTIESASLVASDYSVTVGNFTGGLINVVTRSGTNEFDGSLFYYRADEDFRGNVTNGTFVEQAPFTEEEYGITLGGPIIEDELFFFVSYDKFETGSTSFFATGDEALGIEPGFFDALNQMIVDVYGVDMGGRPNTVSNPSTAERYLAKLDWNINADHRASFTYQSSEESNTSTSSSSLASAWYDNPVELTAYTFQLFSDWTPELSTTFRVNLKNYDRSQDCRAGRDTPQLEFYEWEAGDLAGTALDGLLTGTGDYTFIAGCDRFRHGNEYSDERLQVFGSADYIWGDHLFTFGVEYEQFELFNLFAQRSSGDFRFYTPQDFLNNDASVIYQNGTTNDRNDIANTLEYDRFTAFAQDTWQIADNFAVNFGFRYERFIQDQNPVQDANIESRYGISSTATLDGKDVFLPRIGFRYEPFDRTTVTGGVGLFAGGEPRVWISNAFALPAVYLSGNYSVPTLTVPQPLLDAAAASTAGRIDIISPNFELPRQLKASVRVDQEFDMNFGFLDLGDNYRVTAQYLYTRDEESFAWRNRSQLDLGYTVGTAPDGRPIYADLQDQWEGNVHELGNVSGSEGHVFTIALNKQYENGIGFNASYAYQDVESMLEDTSSRGVSSHRGQITSDRNNVQPGTSIYQVEDRFALAMWYEREFFGELTTRFDVFGEFTSGTPYSYVFDVSSSNALFGRQGNFESPYDTDLLYIPTANDTAVVYGSGFDQARFNEIIDLRGLTRGEIASQAGNAFVWSQQWDVRIQQELPGIPGAERWVGDNRLQFVVDIDNFANLLNDEWGTEYNGVSRGQAALVRADLVSAADVALNGVDGASALRGDDPRTTCINAGDCVYRYNSINSWADDRDGSASLGRSVYNIRVGLRYEF